MIDEYEDTVAFTDTIMLLSCPVFFYIKAFTLGNATRCLNFLGLAKSLDSAYFPWNL